MNQTKILKKKTVFSELYKTKLWLLILSLVAVASLFSNCKDKPRQVEASFYHWKTNFQPSDFEKNYCKQLAIKRLYVRLFDVDWNESNRFPYPLAISDSIAKTEFEIVPTIFITNKTFIKIPDNQVDSLAALIFNKIGICTDSLPPRVLGVGGVNFKEIQIDCDWTETTQKRFFSFLKVLKAISNKKISATIRLHQVKFRAKTGIPPVDEGVLMAYNMGNLDDATTLNSILDIKILKSYIGDLKNYPLKLNVALPIFSWGVVLRDGEVVKLINNLDKKQIQYTPRRVIGTGQYETVFNEKTDGHFEILKNTYLNGFYLYKDDEIRLENIPLSILQESADVIAQNMGQQNLTVIFYHLDSVSLQRYRYEDLDNIIQRFQ